MSSRASLRYSSSNIHRATRINSLESTRLQQKIRYIEQAKVHQCRLTNQDIRLISTSIGCIQSNSGHSLEVTLPNTGSVLIRDIAKVDSLPYIMYGERIWSRRKRFKKLTSDSEGTTSDSEGTISGTEGTTSEWNSNYFFSNSVGVLQPYSEHSKHRALNMCQSKSQLDSQDTVQRSLSTEIELDFDRFRSRLSTPKSRTTPLQTWENNISEVTKKILASQTRAQSGKRQSVYKSHVQVDNTHTSRNARDLLRKIRISTNVDNSFKCDGNYRIQSLPRPNFSRQYLKGRCR